MKHITNIRCFTMALSLAIVTLLLPTLGHAQTTQDLNGGTQTWDTGNTADWDGSNKWVGGDDNANIGAGAVTVDNSFGQVTVNTMVFLGSSTVSGGPIEENPFTTPNYMEPVANTNTPTYGDETLAVVYNNATVTINSQINVSDLGPNQQDYIVNNGSGNLTLNNIDFGAYTLNPAATNERRVNLAAYGSGHIIINGNVTESAGFGGQINLVGAGSGQYDITSSANFASFGGGNGNILNSYGGTLNIANSTFTASQNMGFGNHDGGVHAINVVGAQTIAFSVYDSLKYGNDPDSDGVTTDGTVFVNQSTANASTMSGGWNLDGSNVALSAVAGGRLTMSGNLGGGTPGGMVVSGNGIVVLSNASGNGYNEVDGNGYIQPTSNIAADLQGGTTLITNTSGSAFGAASTTANNPANPGNNTTVVSMVKVEAGATLGGSGISAPMVVVAGGGIIAPGDPGQAGLSIPASIATLHLTGGLSMASGSTLAFKLNGAPGANDMLDLGAGALTLTGTTNVDFTGTLNVSVLGNTNYYTLATGTGTWSSTPTFNFTAPAGYVVDHVIYDPNSSTRVFEVNFAAVPEPSTYALMIGGLAFLAFCVRRKNRMV